MEEKLMFNITVVDSQPRLSAERIAQVEHKLGFAFPQSYREFLLQFNGGRPRSKCRFILGEHNRGSYVDWFLSIYEGKPDNLETYYQVFKGQQQRLPDELVPIAHDPGGNLICIAVSGASRGAVFFWKHEDEEDEPTYDNVRLIASTFEDFIDGLQDFQTGV